MENPEEILHCLEEFSKARPKDIPRELEDYLCFVAKTGDPVYQWSVIKSLFREKMINVITDFYEQCPSVEIPPLPNVELFNYDVMKNFILEKLDTFASAPFTVQRICELLTTPRKEYSRIDKYMRALEKNVLVVSTTEPGGRRTTENGDGIVNGLESDHLPETSNSSNDINVEEMDDTPAWPRVLQTETAAYPTADGESVQIHAPQETFTSALKISEVACSSSTQDTVITCRSSDEPYVSIEPVPSNACSTRQEDPDESDVSVTITAIPAGVQKRRNSVEPVVSSETTAETTESKTTPDDSEAQTCDEPSKEEPVVVCSATKNKSDESPEAVAQEVKDADSSSNVEDAEAAAAVSEDKKEKTSIGSPSAVTSADVSESISSDASSSDAVSSDAASSTGSEEPKPAETVEAAAAMEEDAIEEIDTTSQATTASDDVVVSATSASEANVASATPASTAVVSRAEEVELSSAESADDTTNSSTASSLSNCSSETPEVDTTKCSDEAKSSMPVVVESLSEDSNCAIMGSSSGGGGGDIPEGEDSEITSSENSSSASSISNAKPDEEEQVRSSEDEPTNSDEAKAKVEKSNVEEEPSEVNSPDSVGDGAKVESQTERQNMVTDNDAIAVSSECTTAGDDAPTPMEVDDDYGEKVSEEEEIVKAESTSDTLS